jgi:hypothetical protein
MGVHEMLSRIRNRPLQLSLVSAVMPNRAGDNGQSLAILLRHSDPGGSWGNHRGL